MIQLIGGSGGWSVNRRDRGVLKGGLNQVDDLTLPAVSPQPPNPQVDCKLPHLAGTSKKRIHVLMFYAQRLISCGAASWCLFTSGRQFEIRSPDCDSIKKILKD